MYFQIITLLKSDAIQTYIICLNFQECSSCFSHILRVIPHSLTWHIDVIIIAGCKLTKAKYKALKTNCIICLPPRVFFWKIVILRKFFKIQFEINKKMYFGVQAFIGLASESKRLWKKFLTKKKFSLLLLFAPWYSMLVRDIQR